MTLPAALRLNIDLDALAVNYRALQRLAGVDTGAAVKADAYGLGAAMVASRLYDEGCRTFYVAAWQEAAELGFLPGDARIVVLHGVEEADMAHAVTARAEPIINSPEQAGRWQTTGRPCDLMIDTGMNRLGVDWRTFSADLVAGLAIDTVHSHLACADDPASAMNAAQLSRFRSILATLPAGTRASIAGSGGACLGRDYALDHIRPGLGLYGGVPNPAASGVQVVRPEARVIQVREVPAGDTAGYGATWRAARNSRLAILNIGYADGYLTGFSNRGAALAGGVRCPVAGRVSMDLTIVDVTDAGPVAPGDWLELDFELPAASAASGLSQYELLTGLGRRYDRVYQ
jgi:alanine racemase